MVVVGTGSLPYSIISPLTAFRVTANQIATRGSLILPLLTLGVLAWALCAFSRPLLVSPISAAITFPQHKRISDFAIQRYQVAPDSLCGLILHLVDKGSRRVYELRKALGITWGGREGWKP